MCESFQLALLSSIWTWIWIRFVCSQLGPNVGFSSFCFTLFAFFSLIMLYVYVLIWSSYFFCHRTRVEICASMKCMCFPDHCLWFEYLIGFDVHLLHMQSLPHCALRVIIFHVFVKYLLYKNKGEFYFLVKFIHNVSVLCTLRRFFLKNDRFQY